MPHKKARNLKKRIREKRKAEQVKQARKERKRVEKRRRLKRKVTKPVRKARAAGQEVKEAGRELKETGSEAAKLARAKTPGVSSFERRGGTSAETNDKALDTDRERKIVLAQQLRNEGLTLQEVGDQIGMSPSWVSTNTVPPTAGGQSSTQGDSGGSFLDDLTDTFESIEGDVFGSDAGVDGDNQPGTPESIDDRIADIDDDLDMDDGDFDIDLEGID